MITKTEREQVAQRIRAQRERRAERSLVRDEILESRGRDLTHGTASWSLLAASVSGRP